jgi:hypothetical protein
MALSLSGGPFDATASPAPHSSVPSCTPDPRHTSGTPRMPVPAWRMALRCLMGGLLALLTGVLAFTAHTRLDAHRPDPASSMAGTPAPPVAMPSPSRSPFTNPRLTASLASARASLRQNDLAGAKAALASVVEMQPDNLDAHSIQRDITQREQRRDAALARAKGCETSASWDCVLHDASDALAIDAGNVDSQTLLQHALVATGWNAPAPAATHAPPNAPSGQALRAATSVYVPPADSTGATERAIRNYGWRTPATDETSAAATAPTGASIPLDAAH